MNTPRDVFVAAICSYPGCNGWAAWHLNEGMGGMWHDHDGDRYPFVRLELVPKALLDGQEEEQR